ncbi:uncharacterized, partial [Tachysurus ichikawai]
MKRGTDTFPQAEGCVLLKERSSDTALVFYCNIWTESERWFPE